MGTLKYTQLCLSEIKQDAIGDFNLISSENNIALLGSNNELITLSLTLISESTPLFPYSLAYVEIPQQRPCACLFENVDLQHIYNSCNIQERQELALEPMYIAEYSFEPIKAKALQVQWAPWSLRNEQPLLAVLTSYGACQLLSKTPTSRRWQQKLGNINKYFMNSKHFPLKKSISEMHSFVEFKQFLDQYWITAFTWHMARNKRLLFAANAAGYVVAFEFDVQSDEVSEYCIVKTEIGRINYLKAFDDFLLVSNIQGIVELFKIDYDIEIPRAQHVETLCNKVDRMPCRRAEVTHAKDLNCYFIVFPKAGHLLAYRISSAGHIISKSRLYTGCVKITAIESLDVQGFIATTVIGKVLHIRLSCANAEELSLHAQDVETEFDTTNFQILGIAKTCNRSLWSFMLYRSKEYMHSSKYNASSAFVSVCKLNSISSLEYLNKASIRSMNVYMDYVIAIGLDIMNGLELDKYNGFCKLTPNHLPNELDETFLQKLQIKLLIHRKAVSYQRLKYKKLKISTSREFEFLIRAVQLVYLLNRLIYLKGLSKCSSLSSFQQLASNCMKAKYELLLGELLAMGHDENTSVDVAKQFFSLASAALSTENVDSSTVNWKEQCLICNEPTSPDSMKCVNAHQVKRCIVSYVQLPVVNRRYCPLCNCYALEDDAALQQLFAPSEVIKCTLCRFLFVNDAI